MRRTLYVLALLPFGAFAQPDSVSYGYFHLGHSQAEVDIGTTVDFSGPELLLSGAAGKHVYVFGSYSTGEADDFDNFELTEMTFGVGAHFEIADKVSLYSGMGYVDIALDTPIGDASDDGLYLQAGLRAMPAARLELRIGLEHAGEFDLLERDTAYLVGADLFVSDVVSFALNYREYDDINVMTLAARFHFGDRRPANRRRR